jgi:4-hydroxybenzoate polyprenyltransferase
LEFVKFEHTLFSLPLLLAGAFLGAGGMPPLGPLLWVVVAGTGARTLAMALNRIIDRRIDATNPRTATRELPSGAMSLAQGWGVALAGLALFFFAILRLPPLCLTLSPIPLAIFVLYPFLKRFTWFAHFGVGAGLAFGPIAAFVAITGTLPNDSAVLWLAAFTWLWVGGFDVIYATLDEDFDRRAGLHSIPARFGRQRALTIAAGIHVVAFACLAVLTARFFPTPWSWALCLAVGAMLFVEHRQVRNVDLAFFQINAALGFVVFALVCVGTLAS